VHLVPGCPAHVLLPLLVLFYNMFEQINNQSINQSNSTGRPVELSCVVVNGALEISATSAVLSSLLHSRPSSFDQGIK